MAKTKQGFRRAKTVLIEFAGDHELAGLEVRLKRISMQAWIDIRVKYASSPWMDQVAELVPLLHSWNLEDEDTGAAIPATPEGFWAQDPGLHLHLMRAWGESILPPPLVRATPEPEPDPDLEADLPMEPL